MRRIAQISDIHFGAQDPDAVEALAADLKLQRYDLLIVSGDFTQRARGRQFKAAMKFLKRLPGPHLYVPGNHDVPLYDVTRRFFSPTGKYRKHVTADLHPVFHDEQLLVMGLNTARPFSWTWDGFWKDGKVGAEELLHVHRVCLATPDELFKIVVTHHPFIPPPGNRAHGIVHGATRALLTMEAVGVEVLLAGHLHMNYSGDVRTHHEATKRSILSVQAGTACSHRRRGDPNAYNIITVEAAAFDGVPCDRLGVQVRTMKDGAFRDGPHTGYERREEGWIQIEGKDEAILNADPETGEPEDAGNDPPLRE